MNFNSSSRCLFILKCLMSKRLIRREEEINWNSRYSDLLAMPRKWFIQAQKSYTLCTTHAVDLFPEQRDTATLRIMNAPADEPCDRCFEQFSADLDKFIYE